MTRSVEEMGGRARIGNSGRVPVVENAPSGWEYWIKDALTGLNTGNPNQLELAAAEEVRAPIPMASLVHDRFLEAMALGLSNADWSAISRVSLRNAGL